VSQIDLRKAMNAISEVVANRPKPLREFDQIYMKSADMLLQAEHVSRWFGNKHVLFVGDGDAIGLCLAHLHAEEILTSGPASIHVIDFDERVIRSIENFVDHHQLKAKVTAELYNVADPLPRELWCRFDGFYTNPPYGKSNNGKSIQAFMQRGMEACGLNAIGCIVLADHPDYEWTQEVLLETQHFALDKGFLVAEMIPNFHGYHLDDTPELTSCSLVIRRMSPCNPDYASEHLPADFLKNFYGADTPLQCHYIRDLTNGGKLASTDHLAEPYEPTRSLFES
jgi:predicted methyltransferase